MSQSVPALPLPSPRRGEIYWVEIPKNQAEGSEHRNTDDDHPHPYVVVSRNSANERLTAVVGVPLSSRVHKANKTYRPMIKASDLSPDPGREVQDSVALCDHIREIAIQRLAGKIGRATTVAMSRIENAIAFFLDGGP